MVFKTRQALFKVHFIGLAIKHHLPYLEIVNNTLDFGAELF